MDEAQELVNKVYAEVERKFAPFAYPVYALVEENLPVLIGTCFAFRYCNRSFLITAAQVIDNSKKATLALGTPLNGKLVTIHGEFHITVKVNGDREEDPFDFAWHELTNEEAQKIACIPECDVEVQPDHEKQDRVYVAMGYPVSKNNRMQPEHRKARRLNPKRATYMNLQSDASSYFDKRGMKTETHIAIKRENRSLGSTREEENTIGHKGLSGGPVIDSGMRLSPPGVGSPKVSGLVIERDETSRMIIAVRLSVITAHISANMDSQL